MLFLGIRKIAFNSCQLINAFLNFNELYNLLFIALSILNGISRTKLIMSLNVLIISFNNNTLISVVMSYIVIMCPMLITQQILSMLYLYNIRECSRSLFADTNVQLIYMKYTRSP